MEMIQNLFLKFRKNFFLDKRQFLCQPLVSVTNSQHKQSKNETILTFLQSFSVEVHGYLTPMVLGLQSLWLLWKMMWSQQSRVAHVTTDNKQRMRTRISYYVRRNLLSALFLYHHQVCQRSPVTFNQHWSPLCTDMLSYVSIISETTLNKVFSTNLSGIYQSNQAEHPL